jgi:hypothetical protein
MTKLLSVNSDAKTIKGQKKGYLTGILYLMPYNLSGYQVCPMASQAKCHAPCLNTAGRGAYNSVQQSRLKKTQWFFEDRKGFVHQLEKDIEALIRKAERESFIPAVRLNGTSDIRWENYDIIQNFPDVQFYDYTKIHNRKNLPDNYHLTWSYSNVNNNYASNRPSDLNWAAVFRDKLPSKFLGRRVIDGDETDLRFLDPDNVIVGLKAKGKARKDTSGFVV